MKNKSEVTYLVYIDGTTSELYVKDFELREGIFRVELTSDVLEAMEVKTEELMDKVAYQLGGVIMKSNINLVYEPVKDYRKGR